MTDHHSGYIVTLATDIREGDAEAIINALRMVKGVLSVKPLVDDHCQHIANERAYREWGDMLYRIASQASKNGPASIAPKE